MANSAAESRRLKVKTLKPNIKSVSLFLLLLLLQSSDMEQVNVVAIQFQYSYSRLASSHWPVVNG